MSNKLPFHAGEIAIQKRLGVHERVAMFGSRLIRDHLTDEHAEFFPMLPTLLVGSRDIHGAMWASCLFGQPGFLQTQGPRSLLVNAKPVEGDPLNGCLIAGQRLGLLGLQFQTRRRNRISGRVDSVTHAGFSIAIDQTFGNCPKYIQTREPTFSDTRPGPPVRNSVLTDTDKQLISQADTFFIASGVEGESGDPRVGNDISHRGGRPGFVRVEGNELLWPDFVGNFLFNTLGNLGIDPRAGLLFLDFETGDSLQLTGRAEVVWDAEYQSDFPGAERFVRFITDESIRIPAAMPFRWKLDQFSPFLKATGVWMARAG